MRWWHNAVRRKRKKPAAVPRGGGGSGWHYLPDATCPRQKQHPTLDRNTWLTSTGVVPLIWLHLLLTVALNNHIAAATTAINPGATVTTQGDYAATSTVTSATLSSATAASSSSSAAAASASAATDKFSNNWGILEDPFKGIVRIGDGNTVARVSVNSRNWK